MSTHQASQLTGQDAGFMYIENELIKSHFTLLTIYDQSTAPGGHIRYRDVVRYFEERVAGLPVLRRKLHRVPFDLDAPYFVDDPHFHIESHVRHIALPEPGDWRQFCILAAGIQAQPIDTSKPLWDMTIVGGLDKIDGMPPNSFAILTRLHHAIADGTTARGILAALHHPAGEAPPALRPQPMLSAPTLGEMLTRGLTNNARQIAGVPPRLLRILPGAGPTLANAARATLEKFIQPASDDGVQALDRVKVPKTLFNGDMEYRRVFQMRRYPLAGVKRMRTLADGATLNDAVLAVIGGAMRRYLAAVKEKADIDLYALCPINLRDDKRSDESHQGNNVSLMQINLGTRATKPAQRLQRVVDATRAAKLQQKASTAKEIIALSQNAPNVLLAVGTRIAAAAAFRQGSAVRVGNCIVTNVPGPQEPLYFMGAKLVVLSALGPVTSGSGPIFTVSSYLGELCIGFTACPKWIKDPQLMAQCLDDSYAELAGGDHKPAAPRPQAKPARRQRAAVKRA